MKPLISLLVRVILLALCVPFFSGCRGKVTELEAAVWSYCERAQECIPSTVEELMGDCVKVKTQGLQGLQGKPEDCVAAYIDYFNCCADVECSKDPNMPWPIYLCSHKYLHVLNVCSSEPQP